MRHKDSPRDHVVTENRTERGIQQNLLFSITWKDNFPPLFPITSLHVFSTCAEGSIFTGLSEWHAPSSFNLTIQRFDSWVIDGSTGKYFEVNVKEKKFPLGSLLGAKYKEIRSELRLLQSTVLLTPVAKQTETGIQPIGCPPAVYGAECYFWNGISTTKL